MNRAHSEFQVMHTMIRVMDPEKSIGSYTEP
jgi:hypothetical protein